MKSTVVTTNKRAYHDYFVEETYEAGIVLIGCEVKSIRLGSINLSDSYVTIRNGQPILVGTHISPYEKGSYNNREARRDRALLLNRSEIRRLKVKVEQKGFTLIPLKVYFKDALVKVEIGLCKGKATYDKRETIKKKQDEREMERAMKNK